MAAGDPSGGVRQHISLPRRVLAGYSLGSLVTCLFGARRGAVNTPRRPRWERRC